MLIGGHITRSNLPTPLADLAIQQDPYWLLLGDGELSADQSRGDAGVEPSMSALKTVWADSPFVAGKIPVLATPDNAMLSLRMLVVGTTVGDCETKAGAVINAIRNQLTYQVSVTYDTGGAAATFTWVCFPGDYQVSIAQMFLFGYLLPLHLELPRYGLPVAGPV